MREKCSIANCNKPAIKNFKMYIVGSGTEQSVCSDCKEKQEKINIQTFVDKDSLSTKEGFVDKETFRKEHTGPIPEVPGVPRPPKVPEYFFEIAECTERIHEVIQVGKKDTLKTVLNKILKSIQDNPHIIDAAKTEVIAYQIVRTIKAQPNYELWNLDPEIIRELCNSPIKYLEQELRDFVHKSDEPQMLPSWVRLKILLEKLQFNYHVGKMPWKT